MLNVFLTKFNFCLAKKGFYIIYIFFNQKRLQNSVFLNKNPAYGKHWIFWPMGIVSPLPWRRKKIKGDILKDFFFFNWICHLLPVTCHLSPVQCHMSWVTCYMSSVTCHYKNSHSNKPSPLLHRHNACRILRSVLLSAAVIGVQPVLIIEVGTHWRQVKSYLTPSRKSWSHIQRVHLWNSPCWCHSVDVTLLMSFFWCHSVDVHCTCPFVDVTLKVALCWCHFVNVSLLMSLCWCQSVDVTLLTIRYANEIQLYFLFEGMTDTSKDMTKTTWTFLSELLT